MWGKWLSNSKDMGVISSYSSEQMDNDMSALDNRGIQDGGWR